MCNFGFQAEGLNRAFLDIFVCEADLEILMLFVRPFVATLKIEE